MVGGFQPHTERETTEDYPQDNPPLPLKWGIFEKLLKHL
jgi:hypothetical protein